MKVGKERLSEHCKLLSLMSIVILGILLAACSTNLEERRLKTQADEPLIIWHSYDQEIAEILQYAADLQNINAEFIGLEPDELGASLAEAVEVDVGPHMVIGPILCTQPWCSKEFKELAEKLREAYEGRIPPELFELGAWCDPRFCDPSGLKLKQELELDIPWCDPRYCDPPPYAIPFGWDYLGVFADLENLDKFQLEMPNTLEAVEEIVVDRGFGIGLAGYTPHPDDPYPWPRWPFPWPSPYGPWPWFMEDPNPQPARPIVVGHSSQFAEILGKQNLAPLAVKELSALSNVHRVYVSDKANPDTAAALIDGLLSTEIQMALFEHTGMLPSTAEALTHVSEKGWGEFIDYASGDPNPQPSKPRRDFGDPSPDPGLTGY